MAITLFGWRISFERDPEQAYAALVKRLRG
jgi:hypothetical protein